MDQSPECTGFPIKDARVSKFKIIFDLLSDDKEDKIKKKKIWTKNISAIGRLFMGNLVFQKLRKNTIFTPFEKKPGSNRR